LDDSHAWFRRRLARSYGAAKSSNALQLELEAQRRGAVSGFTMAKFTTLISGLSFTECPRWRDGRLYVSNFYAHRVLVVAMAAKTMAYVPRQPSGHGFLPDGRMLIVFASALQWCAV
jgi:hypothetical protein